MMSTQASTNSLKKEASTVTNASNGIPFPPVPVPQGLVKTEDSADDETVPQVKEEHDDTAGELPTTQSLDLGNPVSADTQSPGQVLPEQPDVKVINRQINGYVGFANLPKQWHRRSIKNGFSLNLLCVGKSGMGKTTMINSLFNETFDSAARDTTGIIPEQPLDISMDLSLIHI